MRQCVDPELLNYFGSDIQDGNLNEILRSISPPEVSE